MRKNVKAVLFDFDGVLVDSMPIHLAAWKDSFHELFGQDLNEEVLNSLVGKSTISISKTLCQRAGKPLLQEALIDCKKSHALKNLQAVRALPGANEICYRLEQLGIPYGIVSNAPKSFIFKVLDQINLEFPFVFGVEDYTKPKPHPQPYIMGARHLGLDFSDYKNCIVFEDSFHGLKAAANAKMHAIGICTQHSHDSLLKAGAKACFKHLQDALSSGLLE